MSQTLLMEPPVYDADGPTLDELTESERTALYGDGPLVTDLDGPPLMPDAEAFSVLKRISAVQAELADIDANAKTMKAQAVADLKDYLGNYDRLPRLMQWHASKLRGKRRSVTVLTGSIGRKTVPARCVVADAGLALPWLTKHAPEAVVTKIEAKRLPAPITSYDEHGEITWKAPGPGLIAEPEREEVTVNGKQLSTLLKGAAEGDSDV